MRALTLVGTGGLEHLKVQSLPDPVLVAPTDVRVRLRAAALNHLDLFVAGGMPGIEYAFPHIPGSDGAGIVESVGSAVRTVKPGDRVMINPGISCGECRACRADDEPLCNRFQVLGEHRSGTIAEYAVVPESNLAPVPEAMPWSQAAAFSLATLTAWRMMATRAQVQAGEWVLVWGVGGGVALAAVQIGALLGARIIATSGSATKLEAARRLGAAALINHAQQDVVAETRKLTEGRGADVVIDSVGEKTWVQSGRAMRRGGRLVICGATTGPIVSLDLRRLFWHQWNILGSTMGSRKEYQAIVRHAEAGRLWPLVDRVVPLEQASEAYGRLARGEQTGKVVIELSP